MTILVILKVAFLYFLHICYYFYILWEDVSWISLQNSIFEIFIHFLVASSPFFNRRSLYSCEKNNWCLRKKNSWAQNIHFYVSDAIFLKEESYWLLKKIEVGHLKSTYRPHEFFLQGNNFFTKKKFSFKLILILRLRCFRAILDLSWRKSNVQEIQFYLLGVYSDNWYCILIYFFHPL